MFSPLQMLGIHRYAPSHMVSHREADYSDYRSEGRGVLHLRTCRNHVEMLDSPELLVVVRGYATLGNSFVPETVLADIRTSYCTSGNLPTDRLKGSFTIVLLDKRKDSLVIYRNLVGSSNTFYTQHDGALIFGDNLASVVRASGLPSNVNHDVLPELFLFRTVPDVNTLFRNVFRLMPGESLEWKAGCLTVKRMHTFAEFPEEEVSGREAVDAIDDTMSVVTKSYQQWRPASAVLLSGGVDSSYLLAHWKQVVSPTLERTAYCVTIKHERVALDDQYAQSVSRALNWGLKFVTAERPYEEYLNSSIVQTADMPNHVQSVFFPSLADGIREGGYTTGICGEAADGLFGVATANKIHNAMILRALLPLPLLRRLAARFTQRLVPLLSYYATVADDLHKCSMREHPVLQQSVFTNWESSAACFGDEALLRTAQRHELLTQNGIRTGVLERLHAANLLTSSINTAAHWSTLANTAGLDMLCPFLDSRIVQLAYSIPVRYKYPFRRPKELLKEALCRHLPRGLVYRQKRGFGQPIFEWLSKSGQLYDRAHAIDQYDFVPREVLKKELAKPSWFLYTLLCYDIWYKAFIGASNSSWPSEGAKLCAHLG